MQRANKVMLLLLLALVTLQCPQRLASLIHMYQMQPRNLNQTCSSNAAYANGTPTHCADGLCNVAGMSSASHVYCRV